MAIDYIYLDMDGVLADFNLQVAHTVWAISEECDAKAARCDKHHFDNWQDVYGLSDDEVWRRINQEDTELWWSSIEPLCNRYPGTPMPSQLHKWAARHSQVTAVLTALPRTNGERVAAGKLSWLQNWIEAEFSGAILCSKRHKALLARDNALLIDDDPDNCGKFVEAGGRAIQYRPVPLSVTEAAFDDILKGARHIVL